LNSKIKFQENYDNMMQELEQYYKDNKLTFETDPKCLKYVNSIRPIHRCKIDIFKLIISHGCLISNTFQDYLINNKEKGAIEEIKINNGIATLFKKNNFPNVPPLFDKFSENYVKLKFSQLPDKTDLQKVLDESKKKFINTNSILKEETVEKIIKLMDLIISVIQNFKTTGIKYDVDKKLETNKQIFSIIGKHTGDYYGDIIIILNQEIMMVFFFFFLFFNF
jgi:hypothetical protein